MTSSNKKRGEFEFAALFVRIRFFRTDYCQLLK